jgi:hypothetical protein|tara:strand:+ start:315 stop:1856 length:1542 start_codon:yes stop_codon:yes gene_type:complete
MAREKPIPRSARKEINRGRIRSRDNDTVKQISVGLMDIDAAIMFYFNNTIQPMVEENGESIKVPLMYSNPERWAMVQKNGYLVDNKKQLIIPLIAFKRTSIEKDDTMSVDKLDPKDPKLFYTFQRKYSEKNRYDKFSVQQGLNKVNELYTVGVPDYVSVTYDFVIWTSYTEQMNKIVEKIIWSEGSYWGEDGKFKFRTSIDNYTDASEVSVNSERLIRTNFSVTLKGYLIPEEFNKVLTTQKTLTPKRILIGDDVSVNLTNLVGDSKTKDVKISVQQGSSGGALDKSIKITAGTGVSIGGAGIFDGTESKNFTFAIGQEVGTTSTVQFNNVTASNAIHIGPTSFEISQRDDGKAQVNTDWVVKGDIFAENYIVSSSIVSMSVMQSSGSTIFGDTIDDNHQFTGSVNISGSLSVDGVTTGDTNSYLRKQFVKKANSITAPSTASFAAVTASAPNGLTATSEQDFVFFINGQYMEHDALTIQQAGSTFHLIVDVSSIGYDLESDDEIIAQGKFNS